MSKFVKFTDAATSHEIFVNVNSYHPGYPDFIRPNANVDSHGKSQNPTFTIDENVDAVMQKLGG